MTPPPGTGGPESDLLSAFRPIYEQGHRAWNAGDFELAFGLLPEDIEWQPAPNWPHARRLRGPDQVVSFFEDLGEAFADLRTELREFVQPNPQTVIIGFDVFGTGDSSGAGTTMEIWQVWEMREAPQPLPAETVVIEGMVPFRVSEFHDRDAALQATGADQTAERGS